MLEFYSQLFSESSHCTIIFCISYYSLSFDSPIYRNVAHQNFQKYFARITVFVDVKYSYKIKTMPFLTVTTTLREHASCKSPPPSLSRGGEGEAQEKAPGTEPHGHEVSRLL